MKVAFLIIILFSVSFAEQKAFVEDEILVKVKPDSNFVSLVESFGDELLEVLGDLNWVRVRLREGLSVDEAIKIYKNHPEIESSQPNFYYRLQAIPNDPSFTSLWGLTRISAPSAWDLTTGSSSVVVAVIDTGIRYTHEDLSSNMWRNTAEIPNNGIDDDGNGFIDDYYGYDFRYNDPDPMDENGHGTHVAGTIGAVGNNSLGVVGVNWTVKLMAIKIYSATANDTTSAMLINAYNYVRMMRNRGVNIRVTNNSYADCPEACGYDQATKDALDALGNSGVLNVFAAGNNGRDIDVLPIYPASYDSPHILTVASSTSSDARSSFSNYGVRSVDLAAPGSGILSTYRNSDSSYATLSGTSMATPHVAGAAALLSGYNPSLSVASLKATLMNTVDLLSAWNGLVKSGGRLNVDRALRNQTICNFTLSTDTLDVPTKGGLFTVSVSAPQNCDYEAKSNARWVSILGEKVFSGNGTVAFYVRVNNTVSRTATISIADKTLTIRQRRNLKN
ncbi:MAG: S8 family serine peptidase [Acidobacteriota bacterium]|nr:S8 family serine peptidase [Acidobacteriota bacterium]